MANKNNMKNSRRSEGGGVGTIMRTFVAFVLGYLAATVFDINQMHSWVNKKMQPQSSENSDAKVAQSNQQPKPKLEFYTILAQDSRGLRAKQTPPNDLNVTKHLPVPSSLAKTNPVKVTKPNHKYMLQVGSFNSKGEAEKMRADLVIKGFDVVVVKINQQQRQWYRVMVGPVLSLQEAEVLRSTLASNEHIQGMIRKVDA